MPTKAPTPCATCGSLTTCAHRQRASAPARGYGRDHRARTADAIRHEPWCHTTGGCPWPDSGTDTNPLTGGHPRTLAELGGNRAAWDAQPRIPQCSRCNSGHAPLR
jgi:hypothetical protein